MKKKILIIEDEPALVNILRIKLEQEGFDVLTAFSGEQGLEGVKKNPHLILLDIIMPGMDGFEVLTRLQKNPETKDIPVIILSNSGREEEIQKGVKMGAVDYLIKTRLSLKDVVKSVRKWLIK